MTTKTPIAKRIEKYSWRIGVTILLFLSILFGLTTANEHLQDMDPAAVDFLTGAINLGFGLVAFSFIMALIIWGFHRVPVYWQRIAGGAQ